MSEYKQIHKHHLQLLALQPIADTAVKELLCYHLSCINRQEDIDTDPSSPTITKQFNPNQALSRILQKEDTIKDLHFITTYPTVHSSFFNNSQHTIKDEIQIGKLDAIVVCEILLSFPQISKNLKKEFLVKSIETIKYFRILLANQKSEVFWDAFDHEEGMKLFHYSHKQNWSYVWKDNKQSIVKILKFLKEEEALKEGEYQKKIEEVHLVSNWSKQEILQNWSRLLAQQWKSLSFLMKAENAYLTRKDARVSIHLSEQQHSPSQMQKDETSWLEYILSYLKYLFHQQIEENTSILNYDLDSPMIKHISNLMTNLVMDTFGSQAFVDVKLVDVKKAIQLTEDDESLFVPLIVSVVFEGSQADAMNLRNLYSDDSIELWQQISKEIKACIKHKMNFDASCVRIGWFPENRRINICIYKNNDDLWTNEEESSLIDALMNWEYSYKIVMRRNQQMLNSRITVTFNISTTNTRYFDLVEKFIKLINDSLIPINTDSIEKIDLVEGIRGLLSLIKDSASQLIDEEREVKALGESYTSLELNSARSEGENSSRKTSPRPHPTPKPQAHTNDESDTNHVSSTKVCKTQQQIDKGFDLPDIVVTKENSMSVVSTKQNKRQSNIPIKSNGGKTEVHNKKNGSERSIKLNEDWIRIQIVKEFLIKPAMLSILHNCSNNQSSFPSDSKELYQSIKELHKSHPKAFEIWRKSELNNLLLPNDGKERTDSSLWTIDMIYFVIRTSNMLPPPTNGGWRNPKKPTEKGEESLSFWCWEGRRLKNEIDLGRIENFGEILNRVEEMCQAIGFKSELLTKLKSQTFFTELGK